MRPVCVPCKKLMVKTQVGVNVALIVESVDKERPYEVWSGDAWQCPDCKAESVNQYGNGPFWRHFHTTDVPVADVTVVTQ